jgi:anti-sigma regulatory factor (Ser/Thr protein kinase)
VLRLHRIDLPACWSWSCRPEPSLSGLEAAGRAALLELAEVVALKEPERDELELVLNEALMNAFEHGCLRLAGEEKRRAILAGEYEELLARAAPLQGCGIELTLSLWQGAKEPLLKVEVQDSGCGFSEDFFRRPAADAVTGRGLRLIRNHCDSFYAGGPGGTLVILKALEGEHPWKSNVTAPP